jgi:hypothetical protein
MRLTLAIIALAVPSALLVQSATAQTNDWLLVPGVRVGPVTAKTVRADVARLFPGASVQEDALELEEGFVLPATFVAREKRAESLAIVWTGKTAEAHPKQVFLCRGRGRAECKWHAVAPGGTIAVGVTMLDLEKINGGGFTVHGFGYGYGGNVESWDGGAIGKFDCNNSLSVGVDGARNREGEFTVAVTSEEKQSFSGNRSIASSNAGLRKLNPAVTEILFTFPDAGAKGCSGK